MMNSAGGDHILASPFQLLVEPDVTVPYNSLAYGTGIQEGLAGDFSYFIVQPRDQFGNNRTSLDSVDFQVSLEPLTDLPEFWLEYSAVMSPTDMSVTPREWKRRGFFNVSLHIFPQGLYQVGVAMGGANILGSPFNVLRKPRPAPAILRIKFADSLVRLQVLFDKKTNRGRMQKGSPCTDIFTHEFVSHLGDGSSCDWVDDQEMTISLGFQATVTSDTQGTTENPGLHELNGNLAVLQFYNFDDNQGSPDFLVYRGGVVSKLENSYPASGDSPVLISDNPPTPVAIIVGPTVVGYCDPAVVSAELSYGGGPRPLAYKWKAENHEGDLLTSMMPPIALSTFLSIYVYESDEPYKFTFGKFDLRPKETYIFSLLAQNFLGLRDDTTPTWAMEKADIPLPLVLIDGSETVMIKRNQVLRLSGYADLASCLARCHMDFEWSIVPTANENAGYLVSPDEYAKTRYTRGLHLPPNQLEVGNNYTVLLWGAYRPGKIEGLGHDYNNSGQVKVIVIPGGLISRIGGGNRLVSTQVDLQLSAAGSEDEDGSEEMMRYLWTCQTQLGGPCIDHSNMTLINMANADLEDELELPEIQLPVVPVLANPVLTIPQGGLADVSEDKTGTYYVFSVTVSKYMPTTRTATSSVTLLALNISLPDVAIAPQAKRKHNANNRLILQAVVSEWEYGEVDLRWMVVQGDVSLDVLRDENKLATERTAENLVFRVNTLTVGGKYSFRLRATFAFSEDEDAMTMETYAELEVQVNSPPCAGAFYVQNFAVEETYRFYGTRRGVGLTDRFTMSAVLWADDPEDMPLLYRFGFMKDGVGSVLGDYTDQNILGALLPGGSTNYTYDEIDFTGLPTGTAEACTALDTEEGEHVIACSLADLGAPDDTEPDAVYADAESCIAAQIGTGVICEYTAYEEMTEMTRPPLLVVQAFITDNLLAEQLREMTVIVDEAPKGNVSAASFAGDFISSQVNANQEVGDLADVNRNLMGATDLINAEAPADGGDRRRRMLMGDHRALQEAANNSAVRESIIGTLGGSSEGVAHTAHVITQQTDTLNGASGNPDEVSPNALSGGTGLVGNLVSSSAGQGASADTGDLIGGSLSNMFGAKATAPAEEEEGGELGPPGIARRRRQLQIRQLGWDSDEEYFCSE